MALIWIGTDKSMKIFSRVFVAASIAIWPFTSFYFMGSQSFWIAVLYGLIWALVAGLTLAHVVDDIVFLRIRKGKKNAGVVDDRHS